MQTWMLSGPAALTERGNALVGESPLELLNAYMLSDAVVQMRQGFSSEDYSASNLTGPVEWIARFVTNGGDEEAWAASNDSGTAELGRRSAGVWGPVTFSDTASAGSLRYMHAVGQNGKFFLCYESDRNRLHVWDGTTVRRVGLILATAPTVAQMGGGALSFTRYYRQRNCRVSSGVVVNMSEPSSAASITIAARAGVTVTKGAVSGDGETHWVVEAAASASGPWYQISSPIVVATTTYDDTASSISTTTLSAEEGLYIPPPSAHHIVSDGAVLVMAGAWETAITASGETVPVSNRVWFTRPLGTSDVSDDESIPDTGTQINWIEVGDAGPVTGLLGPIYGEIYVFKASSIYKLVPTGDVVTPYARVLVSTTYGAVDQRLIAEGDLGGVPAIYFADQSALYALASGGIVNVSEAIARDLRQTVITASDGFLCFDPFQRILLFQVSSSPGPTTGSYRSFVFDTAKQQWSGFELGGATAGWIMGVGVMDATTIMGGSGASIINGAYIEDPNGGRRIYLCGQVDATTGSLFKWAGQVGRDVTAGYTTGARYRQSFAAQTGSKVTIGAPTVWYRNPQGATSGTLTLMASFIRDYNQTRTQSVTLEATDDENGVAVKQVTLEGLACADVSTLDARFYLTYSGTAFTSATAPSIDVVSIPYTVQEPLAR